MPEFIVSLIGEQNEGTALWIAAAIAVLIILFLLWLVVRAIRRPRAADGRRSKQARLAVTDAAAIDPRRRLVLVRRDDVEHLIMIGGPTDIVIEHDIRRHASARSLQTPETPAAASPKPVTVAPTPAPATAKPAPKPLPATKAVEPVLKSATAPPAQRQQAPVPSITNAPSDVANTVKATATKVGVATASVGAVATTVSAEPSVKPQTVNAPKPDEQTASDDIEALLDEMAPPKR